ncbi:response regulator [Bacillus sp. 3255]|uniref:response regulator transcription factor n=1 Tax=Bacillus sp. 3255 TaxID=2817904 RepID=UPI002863B11D|nr:response regulator [Bacillus sp. 3255]MDR6882417.1 two-component system response regulator YesN [Bacillus sp. 3255]
MELPFYSASPISMCVIDDIPSVLEGVATQIDWKSHGINVCGTAMNGEEGIRLIEQYRPNIIVTDIRMPKMDGLELSRKAKELFPETKIILLTGYTDFEYAQEAVRLGAFDFITKPFSLNQIEQVVLKAKQAVEETLNRAIVLEDLQKKLTDSMPMLRQEYCNLLIRYRTNEENARQRWEFMQIEVDPERLAVMVLEIDRFTDLSEYLPIQEVELLRFAIQNVVEDTIRIFTKGVVFRESESRFTAIFNTTENITALLVAEHCCQNVERFTRYTVSVGVGGVVDQIKSLPSSFEQAMSSLSYHFYTGGNGVVSFSDVSNSYLQLPRYSPEKEQELLLCLRSGNKNKALALLDDILNELMLTDSQPNPEYLISILHELAFMMIRTLQEKISYEELTDLNFRIRDIKIPSSLSLQEVRQELKDICGQACEKVMHKYRSDGAKIIDNSINFITNNLDKDLSVTLCAKQVHLSANYFANLFKKTIGCTFHQFVLQERMERAKKMLLAEQKVQEIAEMLGFVERRYFTGVFKKYTGMTPSEFREAYMNTMDAEGSK